MKTFCAVLLVLTSYGLPPSAFAGSKSPVSTDQAALAQLGLDPRPEKHKGTSEAPGWRKKELETAAKSGSARAEWEWGLFWIDEHWHQNPITMGVSYDEPDQKKAIEWLRKAQAAGYVQPLEAARAAQFFLIEGNHQEGRFWLEQGALAGNVDCARALVAMLSDEPSSPDHDRDLARWSAMANGDKDAWAVRQKELKNAEVQASLDEYNHVNDGIAQRKAAHDAHMQALSGILSVASAGTTVLAAQQSGDPVAEANAQAAYNQTVAEAVNGNTDAAAATATASANANTTSIQDTLNQNLNKINQTYANSHPQTTAPVTTAPARATSSGIHPSSGAPAPVPTYASTGTVKPPVPYQPAPSSGGTVVAASGNLCPADGWIMVQTGDVAVGHQCTPGQPVNAAATGGVSGSGAGTGVYGSGGSPANPIGGTSGSNGDVISGGFCTGVMAQWVPRQDSSGRQDLWLNSLCAEKVHVEWFVNKQIGQSCSMPGFAKRPAFDSVGPGQDMHVSIYVCPMDHPIAVDANGNQIQGPNQRYSCAKSTWVSPDCQQN